MRVTIVTAADAGYFASLRGLIHSIHRHRPAAAESPHIAVLDLGLTEPQRQELASQVSRFIDVGWDIPVNDPATPSWFRAMTNRPFLPKHVPDADLLIWLDADTWLADWRTIEMLTAAAQQGALAVVPEIDRAYAHLYNWIPSIQGHLHDCYARAYGTEIANDMIRRPVINSGVFALMRDAPHWSAWADWLRRGIAAGPTKMVEQCALNLAIYRNGLPLAPLPSWCNWCCHLALPAYHSAGRYLAHPLPPYEKLSVVHRSGGVKTKPLRTENGAVVEVPLDYDGFTAFANPDM